MSSIRCGNCKNTHETVAEVRSCYETTVVAVPATDSQRNYAQMLFRTRQPFGLLAERDTLFGEEAINKMDKRTISEFIQEMKKQPNRPAPDNTQANLSEGIWTNGDAVRKVYFNLEGTRLLLKELRNRNGNPEDYAFEYVGAASSLSLSGFHKMTEEEARAFGRLYGVCCRCGRLLNDEGSIAAGIGPVCAEKEWG